MPIKINYPPESTITLNINSFENGIDTSKSEKTTNINYARDIQNFNFSSGVLSSGLGFCDLLNELANNNEYDALKRDVEAIGSIEKVFHFYIYNQNTAARDDKLIIVNNELKLFYINLYDVTKTIYSIRNITFTSTPVALNYRLNSEDVMIFSSETDNMVVWNGYAEPYEVLDAPKISSMALHYERLFTTVDGEKNSVWFSDDLDPTNWSLTLEEAGFIELIDERGALLKVVSFCDYLYIFREHGISRLSAYGEQSNFAISNLFVSSGEIYSHSVCVCGDKIIFLASDGLYKFDGVNATKILPNIANNLTNIKNQEVSACYYNGNYYLACKYNFLEEHSCEDNFYSNALLEIDINSYKLKNITHGVNIKYITAIQSNKLSGVIALVSNSEIRDYSLAKLDNSGSFFGYILPKSWTSHTSGIGNAFNHKTLKKIMLESEGDVTITIYHDMGTTSFNITGSSSPIIKRVNIPLNTFAFKIETNSTPCKIHNFKFEFQSTNVRA